MALDLTGITNANEYYTNHYLGTIFEENIKETLEKWRKESEETGQKTPWSKLREAAKKYFIAREKFKRERRPAEKLRLQREFVKLLLSDLKYEIDGDMTYVNTGSDITVPVISAVNRLNGAPRLWIMEVFNESPEDDLSILNLTPSKIQYQQEELYSDNFKDIDFEHIITKNIFSMNEPPRWVMLAGFNEIVLADRTKWGEKRYLSFDLEEIFARREETTLKAAAVLLHRENICPEEGTCLIDTLSDNSYRHASAVSEDLKYALRRCIEALGNAAVVDMKERQKIGVFNKELASSLTLECLRYMYRILFLLFIEARTELGYAPMNTNEYLKGYSIESLRDIIDRAKFDTVDSKNGTYIHETLKTLFSLIFNGYPSEVNIQTELGFSGSAHDTFEMQALKAHIFDPERTPNLNKVIFGNETLHKIIRIMSITRPKSRRDRPGRISYAQLGINQLGAVYEALLSYRGFFAEEDLYEVKKAGDNSDELEVGYFVIEDKLSEYSEDERVRNEDGTLKKYPKGFFIYRLAGREREKSASYYTPEVLTSCLVKYSLKELLKGKCAEEILGLKICEPAMGSAAFLNEAVNQLAEAYLQKRQMELGESIPHDKYTEEKQKVKMYIADRNVYGVDLNPVAVELAEVSLWLNTIYAGAFVPWFGT
ncbi:MAG TPA: N-6 DNA methylase, partial [Candidatus Wallbacteria bacterium]|nr:N-6 DNA methylase [Candidatus Wallbacteria bacterium]